MARPGVTIRSARSASVTSPATGLPPGQSAIPFDVTERHVGFDTIDVVSQQTVSHHYTRRADGDDAYTPHRFRYVWPAGLDLMARA